MSLPNFYIVGAAKSGTSSLWGYLNQHPDIFMSNPKEPNFMVFENMKMPAFKGPISKEILLTKIYNNTITDFNKYKSLFDDVKNEKVIGEASVRYLYFNKAIDNIRKHTPDAKIIIILRNPVDRLYSHYCMMKRYLLEPLDLRNAMDAQESRMKDQWGWDWHYLKVGEYFEQVSRYYKAFSSNQIKVFIYEDFKRYPKKTIEEMYDFLGVSTSFNPDFSTKYQVGYWPKSFKIYRYLSGASASLMFIKRLLPGFLYYRAIAFIKNLNKGKMPLMNKEDREFFEEYYASDKKKLEGLLKRPLPW